MSRSVVVILPTFNRAATLPKAIQSVLDQEGATFQVRLLVIDDGSTDATAAAMAKFKDNRVHYVRQDNQGAAAARNAGLHLAKGDFVAFQDSDDVWRLDKLRRQLAALDRHPQAMWTYSDMTRVDDGGTSPHVAPEVETGRIANDQGEFQCLGIGIQSCLFRAEAIASAGQFDTSLRRFIDLDWLTRMARDQPAIALHEPLVDYYHETPGSISQNHGAAAAARRVLLQRFQREVRQPNFPGRQHLEIARQYALDGHALRGACWAMRGTLARPGGSRAAWATVLAGMRGRAR